MEAGFSMPKQKERVRSSTSTTVRGAAEVDVDVLPAPTWFNEVDPALKGLMVLLMNSTQQLDELEQRQRALVKQLREHGASWSRIGWALGTSGTTARRRFDVGLP